MSEEKQLPKENDNHLARRNFLKSAGFTIGGIAVGGGIVGALMNNKEEEKTKQSDQPKAHSEPTPNFNQALMYFTPEQFKVIEAASEVIFPKTDIGPGAKELLVAYFIDHQLAGNWGSSAKEYMTGPFYPTKAVPEQGYQYHLTRCEIFDLGIELMNKEASKRYNTADKKNIRYHELTEDQQATILKDMEENKLTLSSSIPAGMFFSLLRQVTIEGAYADPMYGGNKDMAGWSMKNFPGHQMNLKEAIMKDELVRMAPKSLNSQHNH
ncbi:gluconate 2-dehydrogenase subunit 3 family protein [Bacillus massiliigorillae]|uniref:gluconate 2-dehydrogenase subunit 3 family protein n=1 Tax=Bacillus massiliigorillae TaxID=1243664 RepID=UPI000399D22D|nr:gluconate 2-dehydrogenase subunit 3 family protein [Bacillus massiliigorillae]